MIRPQSEWFAMISTVGPDVITLQAKIKTGENAIGPAALTTAGNQRFFPTDRISLVIDGIRVPVTSADCGGLDTQYVDLQLPEELMPGQQYELCIGEHAPGWQDIHGNEFKGLTFADTIPPE